LTSMDGVGVETIRLSRRWGDFIIKDVSLAVEPGEYFCVLGPTGAGKTLLLELLAGFFQPDVGNILFDGKDVTRTPPERRGAGFVYQQYMLFPHLNVFENIAFGLRNRRKQADESRRLVEEIAGRLGISEFLERDVTSLSGGEQQRVSLARALVLHPRLLLLDEPTSSVDPPKRAELVDMLRLMHRELGMTVIHVTHDRQEAIALADRIAIIDAGRIVQTGSTEEVFRHPGSEFVARFLGSENIIRGYARPSGELTVVSAGAAELNASRRVTGDVSVTIRPEDIILSRRRTRTSARNVLKGCVTGLEDMGTLVSVTVDCGIPLVVFVTRQSFEELGLTIGSNAYVYFKAQSVHVFKR